MSTIVHQLSYNINEKLRLDDRTFSFEQHHNHNSEAKPTAKLSTSFPTKESSGQWMPPTSAPTAPYVISTSSTTTTSFPTLDENPFAGASGTVVGVACQRNTRRPTVSPTSFPKPQQGENSLTTLFDLHENSAHRTPKKSFSAGLSLNKPDKWHSSLLHKTSNFVPDFSLDEHKLTTVSESQSETFPSIIGRSCTLHTPKKSNFPLPGSSFMTDIPPNKRHCRSVSEPDDLFDASSPSHSISPSLLSWKPTPQSRVWVPIKKLRQSSRRAYSARVPGSSGVFHDCSRSLDGASLNSESSTTQDSVLTPPASPIPRPASVTVIKQEGGAWTFLSSQHTLSGRYHKSSFSPLSSPYYNHNSPSSAIPNDARNFAHPGLSATKRSLSFSEDFEHRESIEYTPTSTPELDRRYFHSTQKGSLARCQSHPSDLNLKKFRSKRHGKHGSRHIRPTLDFAKMKQTSINKSSKCENLSSEQTIRVETATNWPSLTTELSQMRQIKPVFPSLVNTDSPRKKQVLQPLSSASPPPCDVRFAIGVRDVMQPRHVPTTPPATSDIDDVITHMDDARTTSASVPTFVRECNDLDLNLIENDDSGLEG